MNKLYPILFIACCSGWIWVYFSTLQTSTYKTSVEVCLIKQVTNIPCPSCGSTRSINSLIKGDYIGALKINPFGFLIAFIMLSIPFWIIADIATKRQTLFEFYKKIELYLIKPQFAISLILLVVINWIWNITKGL